MARYKRKRDKTKLRMTREGWVYLVILTFVVVGANLRSINLLVFMSGMMFAPLLINWRTTVHILKKVVLNRTVPKFIHAGQFVNVNWECDNRSQNLGCWDLRLSDPIKAVNLPGLPSGYEDMVAKTEKKSSLFSGRANKSNHGRLSFTRVDPGASSVLSYRCMFANRGEYEIGPAYVNTVFPFGILRGKFKIRNIEKILVAPRLGILSPVWDRRLQSIAVGSEATQRRRGMDEDEFYALRGWRSGDSRRHIHWRSTAKRGVPIVKTFDQKSNRDLAFILDLCLPDNQNGTDNDDVTLWSNRCETVISFAASVFTQMGSAVQGKVAVGVCGTHNQLFVGRNNPDLIVQIMRELALVSGTSNPDLGDSISQVAMQISQGTPIYIISSRPQPADLIQKLSQEYPSVANANLQWLDVNRAEFKELFQNYRPDDAEQLTTLNQKWMRHAVN